MSKLYNIGLIYKKTVNAIHNNTRIRNKGSIII